MSSQSVAKNLIAALTLFALGASLAPAAEVDPKTYLGPNSRRLGPLYYSPKIVANAGFDTNVNNAEHDPLQDSAFSMSLTLGALYPMGRRVRLIGSVGLAPNYFTDVASARSLDRSGSIRAEIDVGPLTLSGGFGAGRFKQRFSTEIDDRLWRDETQKNVGVAAHVTKRLTLSATGIVETFRFEEGVLVGGDEVAQSLNHDRRTVSGELDYELTRRTTLLARGEVMEDRFVGTPGAPLDDKVRSYRYLGGLSFTPISQLHGQVLAGWRHYPQGSAATAPAYDGPSLEVHLDVPGVGAGLSLLALRDVYYAVNQTLTTSGTRRNSYVASNYGALIGFNLPLSLLLRTGLTLQRADYILPYDQGGVPISRVDNVWTADGALLRHFGSRVALGGRVQHSWRATNATGLDYGGTRYGFAAEIFP